MRSSRTAGLAIAVAGLVASLCLAPAAWAQESEAGATALFDEGRRLMEQGNYAEACPKLATSQSLAPSGGTLLNLGECYVKTGQTASAWLAFQQAASRASDAHRTDMETLALSRAAKLLPNLAKLVLTAPDGIVGIEVRRNGEIAPQAERGIPIPVDPGTLRVEATAPGRKPWSTTVTTRPGETSQVAIPPLEAIVAPPAPSPSEASRPTPLPLRAESTAGSTQRTAGLVTGGAGVIGLGIGTVFGLRAISKNDEAAQHCRTSTLCDKEGIALGDQAHGAATAATVAFLVGGAALATGVVLYFTAPSSTRTSALRRLEIHGSLGTMQALGAMQAPATIQLRGAW